MSDGRHTWRVLFPDPRGGPGETVERTVETRWDPNREGAAGEVMKAAVAELAAEAPDGAVIPDPVSAVLVQ